MCIRWYVSYVFLVWIYWINPVLPPYGSSMPRWPTRPLSTRWRLWRHGVNLQGGEEGCSLDTRQICSPWEVLWWVVRLQLHCCISQAVRAVGYATLDVAAQCRAAAKSGDPSVFGGVLFLGKTLPKGNHQIWALNSWDSAVLQRCELDLPRRNPDAVSCAEHAVTVRCPILWWKWPAGVQHFNRKAEISNTRVLTLFKFQFLNIFWI